MLYEAKEGKKIYLTRDRDDINGNLGKGCHMKNQNDISLYFR